MTGQGPAICARCTKPGERVRGCRQGRDLARCMRCGTWTAGRITVGSTADNALRFAMAVVEEFGRIKGFGAAGGPVARGRATGGSVVGNSEAPAGASSQPPERARTQERPASSSLGPGSNRSPGSWPQRDTGTAAMKGTPPGELELGRGTAHGSGACDAIREPRDDRRQNSLADLTRRPVGSSDAAQSGKSSK